MGEPVSETREPRRVKVKANWQEPQKDMEVVFSEHLHIQFADDKFYLTFGRLNLPLADLEGETPEVEIQPVGTRFVVPLQAMRKIRDALIRIVPDDPKGKKEQK